MEKRINFKDQRGQAVLTVVVFLLSIGMSIIYGVVSPTLKQSAVAENFIQAGQSYATSESGIEDVIYRLKKGMQVESSETLAVASSTATTIITSVGNSEKSIVSSGDSFRRVRNISAGLIVSNGVSFNYGLQVGNGGFELENSSKIIGNVYSGGKIEGENSNIIEGDVVSSGVNGRIVGVNATGNVYAHSISNSSVGKDAYYQNITNTTVAGTKHPGSPDQGDVPMPIPDTVVTSWEQEAVAGGMISSPCPYKITSNKTLGPVKITCDVEISGSPTITLNGPVWVTGNIIFSNSAVIKVASSLGSKSVVVIADKPSNRITSSQIDINNSSIFQGSGQNGSYVLLLSQNNAAELGAPKGENVAINIQNTAGGALLVYAGHGEIQLSNSARLKEVTAFRVHAKNTASVIYETGLASLLFTSGPSGAWTVKGWKETE